MPTPDMDLEQFQRLLDTHGAVAEVWPAPLRASAERLLRASAEARAALTEARALAMVFDDSPALEAPPYLRARIREIPLRHPPSRRAFDWLPFETLVRPALGLALAALLGVASGTLYPTDDDALTDGWDEVGELALAEHLDSEQW